MHIYAAKSSRFESTDFASIMIDDVGCSRRHQCPQCDIKCQHCSVRWQKQIIHADEYYDQGQLLLTWINFNPSMDK